MKSFLQICCVAFASLFTKAVTAQTPILNSYPSADAVIFLDFDGHTVAGTSWNWTGNPIVCGASGLNDTQIKEVFNRVAEDYRPFNLNVTTDSNKFNSAPIDRRMRVIITVTSSWYGSSGGVAFVGSFIWGDDTPCFVFSALHGYNVKNIAEATAHEAGHTLGLYHQSKYDATCNKVTDYDAGVGTGEIGWAPIMGVGYYKNFTLWNNGPNSLGCNSIQNDLEVISSTDNGFGYRADDHGTSFANATLPVLTNSQFSVEGVIERNTDQDYFRFIMPGTGRFQLDAIPYNVGTGNAGSDLDMQVTLYNDANTALSVYNPGALLSSVADTTLNAGTYYLKIEGKGNQYASEYASLGSYSLQGWVNNETIALPLHKLELRGLLNNSNHQFNWVIEADETIEQQILEISHDGKTFTALTNLNNAARSYVYRPDVSGLQKYRLNVTFSDGHRYYSNILTIRDNEFAARPKLTSNLISTNTVYVSSPENYSYTMVDLHGRTLKAGKLAEGINTISTPQLLPGMYVIHYKGNDQQWTDKFIRQ